MRKYVDGKYIDFTKDEIESQKQEELKAEAEKWATIDYGIAVNDLFRKRYQQHEVEAIQNNYLLDATDEKYAREMQEMQDYRVWCKAFVKQQKEKYK
jgi:hypothetical protein